MHGCKGLFVPTNKWMNNLWTNQKKLTAGTTLPNTNLFSEGVKFKSKHKTLLLFDFFTIGAIGGDSDNSGDGSRFWPAVVDADLCRLMWPPSACPIGNSRPQMVHSCVFGFGGDASSWCRSSPAAVNLGFLWLARWPPSAWNDGNCLLHVLHSNTRFVSPPPPPPPLWLPDNSIKQLAMVCMSSRSDPSLILFIIILLLWEKLNRCLMFVEVMRKWLKIGGLYIGNLGLRGWGGWIRQRDLM